MIELPVKMAELEPGLIRSRHEWRKINQL